MSKERSRPWQGDIEPLIGFAPEWIGQFDTFQDWVSHASRSLTGHVGNLGEEIRPVCIDTKGRRCHIGGDFMRARDEGAFPIRYFVTGKITGTNHVSVLNDAIGVEAASKARAALRHAGYNIYKGEK